MNKLNEIAKSIYLGEWTVYCLMIAMFLPMKLAVLTIIVFISLALINKRILTVFFTTFLSPWIYTFGSIWLFYFIGMYYTESTKEGWFVVEKTGSLILIPYAVILFLTKTPMPIRKMFNVLGCTLTLFALVSFSIALYRQVQRDPTFTDFNWYFFYHKDLLAYSGLHTTYITYYINVFLLFVLLYEEHWHRFLIPILAIFVLMLGSRTGLLTFSIISGVYLFRKYPLRKFLGLVAIFFIALSFLLYTIPITRERIQYSLGIQSKRNYSYGLKQDNEGSIAHRFAKVSCAYSYICQYPLLGLGTGDDQSALRMCYKENNLSTFYSDNYNAHNQYAQMMLRVGVPMSLFFILVYVYAGILSYRSKNYLHVGFLLISGVGMLTENMLDVFSGVAFFSIINAILFFSFNRKQQSFEANITDK